MAFQSSGDRKALLGSRKEMTTRWQSNKAQLLLCVSSKPRRLVEAANKTLGLQPLEFTQEWDTSTTLS